MSSETEPKIIDYPVLLVGATGDHMTQFWLLRYKMVLGFFCLKEGAYGRALPLTSTILIPTQKTVAKVRCQ